MDITKARSEVQRMLLPFQALKSLEEVLDVAARVDAERGAVTKELATKRDELAAVQTDLKLAHESYAYKSAEINSNLIKLRNVYNAQEAAHREKLNALEAQIAEVEKMRDAIRKASQDEVRAAQEDALRQRKEQQERHNTLLAQMKLEEDALRQKLEATRAELAALVRKVS